MTKRTLLKESVSEVVKTGNRWKAVLITPGEGSTGVYREEAIKATGPVAFPKGTHSYVDHPKSDQESRSPKNLMGVLAEDARYEEGVGLVAEIDVFPHWKEFVEAVAPHTGLSIWAMAEGESVENGRIVVESFVPDVQNSVDLVSYPGRPGSGLAEKLYESAIRAQEGEQDSHNGTDAQESATIHTKEEGYSDMELKEIAEAVEAVNAKIDALAETLKPAQVVESEDEVTVEAVAEALVAADLPEVSRKAVYKAIEHGETLESAIAEQKALVEAVSNRLKEESKATEKVAEKATDAVVAEDATVKTGGVVSVFGIKVSE
jgi:hypothetical protein